MSDPNSQKGNVYDVRTVAWYIDKGQIERSDYQEYLKKLPDSESKATEIGITQKEFFDEKENR